MRVFHLCHSDVGGASRAAQRIHMAILRSGLDSRFYVETKSNPYSCAIDPISFRSAWNTPKLRLQLSKPIRHLNSGFHQSNNSLSLFNSVWPDFLNSSAADIVNLHWIQGEMISVKDLSRVAKPLVWTLHDMWPFCGTEHYSATFRWAEGYRKSNKDIPFYCLDLPRWNWERKRKYWTKPMHIVAPSKWMASCVADSELMCSWPIHIIPYPIDTDLWRPSDKKHARSYFNLPQDAALILFGAIGGATDPRKGADLLFQSLKKLEATSAASFPGGVALVVFGQKQPLYVDSLDIPIHSIGPIADDTIMSKLYSCCDLFVVPSLMDNLPNTVLEAQACGTPVVSFAVGGLPDMVQHGLTGFLAEPYDVNSFANCIQTALSCPDNIALLGSNARASVQTRFSPNNVGLMYRDLYAQVLNA